MPLEMQFIKEEDNGVEKYFIVFFYENGDVIKREIEELPPGVVLSEHFFIGCYRQNYVHLY